MEIANLNNQIRRGKIEQQNSSTKITSLTAEVAEQEHKLKIISEENSNLVKDLNAKNLVIEENEKAMRRLNDEIATHRENIGQLEATIRDQAQ